MRVMSGNHRLWNEKDMSRRKRSRSRACFKGDVEAESPKPYLLVLVRLG